MQFDREEQRASVLACIHMAASGIRFDASDAVFNECAAYVKLRREVEAATVAQPQEASTTKPEETT